jgi:hypothetical protein
MAAQEQKRLFPPNALWLSGKPDLVRPCLEPTVPARTAAKAIEKAAIAQDPTINLDKTFGEAEKRFERKFCNTALGACRLALNRLLSMSPVSPYQTLRP